MLLLPLFAFAATVPGPIDASGQAIQPNQPTVYIEDSPAAQELGYQARDMVKERRYADAAQLLQQVIDEYPHKLMPVGENAYTDAVIWVRRELQTDDQLLQAYCSMFEPAASRELHKALPTVNQSIDADALRDVFTRYPLTPSALEAALALSAYHLERAEGADALSVLEQLSDHPDLTSQQARYHMLLGVAAMLMGDDDAYQTQHALLEQIGDEQSIDTLESLTHRIHPPLRLHNHAQAGPVQLPDTLDAPLWEIDLSDELWQNVNQRMDVRELPADQVVLRVIPVIDHERVFINLGHKIEAYDRASGWKLWSQAWENQQDDSVRMLTNRVRGMRINPRGLLIQDDRIFALLGFHVSALGIRGIEGADAELIALRAEDGEVLWRISAEKLDPALTGAEFDGTPIGHGDRLYVVAKRVNVSGLHDAYLTAIDPEDGSLLWRRHLSSTSTQTNYNIGPDVRLSLDAGHVYATDNRGTVVALDSRTGTVHWVTILPFDTDDKPMIRRAYGPSKDIPSPVLVDAGLLVPSANADDPYWLLNAQTGEVLRQLDHADWKDAQACYVAGDHVITVGKSVSCFDGQTLEHLWHKPLDARLEGEVRGKPAIVLWQSDDQPQPKGMVIFCTDHRLMALDLSNGSVVNDVPIPAPGNIALASGQLVIASMADIQAYTDWAVAYDQLKKLAELDPADPRPGMAMARLALRTDRDAQVLEGVDLALAAVGEAAPAPDQEDPAQLKVFNQLRDIVNPLSGANVKLRGDLLDRMAATTANPFQEATYQLLRGGYFVETGDPTRAIEHYQAILADQSLAMELYNVGQSARQAGLEAKRRISSLVQEHGREIYQEYDLLAEHELSELINTMESDPKRYVALADRYPLASSVNEARQMAADLSLEAHDINAALRQLQVLYLDSIDDAQLATVSSRIVSLYMDNERPELAKRWLKRVKRQHPDMLLMRDDQQVHIQSWLSELDLILSMAQRLPRFDLPSGEPRWIDGRPIPVEQQVKDAIVDLDHVLMTDGQEIWLLAAGGLEELWRKPVPVRDLQVLVMDSRQVIWWSTQTKQLGAIDSRTGASLWDTIDCASALENAGDPQLQEQRRTAQQKQFVQILGGAVVRSPRLADNEPESGLYMTVDLTSVLLADSLGRAVCVDRASGRVRWQMLGQADNLTSIALGNDLVALAGASWADTAAQHGIISLLDTLTGEPLETVIQTEKVPSWIGFTDSGLLISAMPASLSAYEPTSGRTEWHSELQLRSNYQQYKLGGKLLMLSDQRGQVGSSLVIDTETGHEVNQLPIRTTNGRPMMFDTIEADGPWYTATPMRAAALDAQGKLLWADAICAPVGTIQKQYVSEDYLCILGGVRPVQIPNVQQIRVEGRPELEEALIRVAQRAAEWSENSGYRLYVLDRGTGSLVYEADLKQIEMPINPANSVLINDSLLLGVGGRTLVLTGKSGGN